MTRSVKRVVLVLLAAAVLAFAAWMLWPRSIGDAVDLDASGDLERKLSVSNGTGKARVNGRVVRIGYFGSGQAAALCEQLSAILRGESGVAN